MVLKSLHVVKLFYRLSMSITYTPFFCTIHKLMKFVGGEGMNRKRKSNSKNKQTKTKKAPILTDRLVTVWLNSRKYCDFGKLLDH